MSTSTPSAAYPSAALLSKEQLQQRYVQNKAELTSHVSSAAGADLRMLNFGGDSPLFYYDAPDGAEVHSGLEHQTVPDAKAPSIVQDFISRFGNRRCSWVTGPSGQARLESMLLAKDFTLDQMEPVMAADVTHRLQNMTPYTAATLLLPKGVSIETVSSAKGVQNWVKTWTHNAPEADTTHWTKIYSNLIGYLPRNQFHMFAAKNEGGDIIGTGYIHYYAGVAAIHAIFVSPQFRGMGIGKALTTYAMLSAKKSNYNTVMLTASSPGMNIFTALGFQTFGTVKLYVWRPLVNPDGFEKRRFDKEEAAKDEIHNDKLAREARRIQKIEKKRLDKEQLEKQQIQIEKIAKELEIQKLENDCLEKEKNELKRAVELLNQKVDKERLEKERMDEAERSERLRSEKTMLELQKTKKIILHQEKLKQAKLEEMRIKAEQAEKQKEAAERLAAQLEKDAQAAQEALEAEQDGWCIV
jgi:N-acetylglutamate synthase-like GNAT family acetyltransferase